MATTMDDDSTKQDPKRDVVNLDFDEWRRWFEVVLSGAASSAAGRESEVVQSAAAMADAAVALIARRTPPFRG